MVHGETGKLMELRGELEKEMKELSEEFISYHTYEETESYLDVIRKLKGDYQNEIEDFVDMFSEVLEKPHFLSEWTEEVSNIGKIVKDHRNKIRDIAFQIAPRPLPKPKYRPIQSVAPIERADMTSWLSDILAVPKRKAAVLHHDSDLHLVSDGSWLKNILPVPRTKISLSAACDKSWLKNILPVPRKQDELLHIGDCDDQQLGGIGASDRGRVHAVHVKAEHAFLCQGGPGDSDQFSIWVCSHCSWWVCS